MLIHMFYSIDKAFRQNDPKDKHRKELIPIKKILQGDAAWSTHKVILGWDLDTADHLLNIPPHRVDTVPISLPSIKPQSQGIIIKQWVHIIGVLCIILPAIAGEKCMFNQTQHEFGQGRGSCIYLSSHMYNKQHTWWQLLAGLSRRPTHP